MIGRHHDVGPIKSWWNEPEPSNYERFGDVFWNFKFLNQPELYKTYM